MREEGSRVVTKAEVGVTDTPKELPAKLEEEQDSPGFQRELAGNSLKDCKLQPQNSGSRLPATYPLSPSPFVCGILLWILPPS